MFREYDTWREVWLRNLESTYGGVLGMTVRCSGYRAAYCSLSLRLGCPGSRVFQADDAPRIPYDSIVLYQDMYGTLQYILSTIVSGSCWL